MQFDFERYLEHTEVAVTLRNRVTRYLFTDLYLEQDRQT